MVIMSLMHYSHIIHWILLQVQQELILILQYSNVNVLYLRISSLFLFLKLRSHHLFIQTSKIKSWLQNSHHNKQAASIYEVHTILPHLSQIDNPISCQSDYRVIVSFQCLCGMDVTQQGITNKNMDNSNQQGFFQGLPRLTVFSSCIKLVDSKFLKKFASLNNIATIKTEGIQSRIF